MNFTRVKDTMNKILVIDDDQELCAMLIEFLQPEGFLVETVYEPHQGLTRALTGEHELIILDVMLPGMTGLELLRKLRSSSQIPVLMLTARGEDIDRILGLEMGADDYLPKPFNPRELLARIHAIQRRIQPKNNHSDTPLECDDIILDPGSRTVKQNDTKLQLTAVEFSLLHEFFKNVGQVMSREALTRSVLNRELDVFDRSIDVHVSSLRKKLGHMAGDRERIKTVRSVGYQYTQPEE
jgi:two-component system response regulator CpxR